MAKIGIIGWRGMVGSVLMQRMNEEKDLQGQEVAYFTTSQAGQEGPDGNPLKDAFNIELLKDLEIVVTCQGGSYTEKVYPELMKSGWKGYWIDAASTLRMAEDSVIVLDPVNRDVIDNALSKNVKTYVGGNCTVSLMLMGLAGLFKADAIEWLTSMTYQAASGAGAKNMKELVRQMNVLSEGSDAYTLDNSVSALDLDKKVTEILRSADFPVDNFGAPLAASLIPWIDRLVDGGQTREEWKGFAETNKILGADPAIPIDGICVRIGAMRSHSQALTIKLKKNIPLDEINDMIASANEWVEVVDNTKEESAAKLTPAAISGTLRVPVGRLHKMNLGPEYLAAFTVGDQLLWGAAEPIRRILRIVLEYTEK